MIAVGEHLDRLGDTLPVVVTFGHEPNELEAYRAHLGIPFPVLADVERQVYRMLGVGRGSFREVWSPDTLKLYARLLRRGRRLRIPTEDTRQLGADAVLDRNGRLHRLWLPPGPESRPPIADVIAAVVSVPNDTSD